MIEITNSLFEVLIRQIIDLFILTTNPAAILRTCQGSTTFYHRQYVAWFTSNVFGFVIQISCL